MLWNLALALREKLPGGSRIVPVSSPPSHMPSFLVPGSQAQEPLPVLACIPYLKISPAFW